MFVDMAITDQSGEDNNVDVMDRSSQQQQEQPGAVLPGFRFHPTDEELVAYYLRRKVFHRPSVEVITQLNIYDFNPWDLPKMSVMKGEKEWYFFCPRDRKYRNSNRPNRVTEAGFWKATGTDRPIYSGDEKHCIGLKKSLVFYTGRAAKSAKTDWMMHEFRMPASSETSTQGTTSDEISLQRADAWAVCRIFKKCILTQRHSPPFSQWAATQPQPILADSRSAPNFGWSESASNPDLEHDSSSQERSDTTSEELEVQDSMFTPQDPKQNYVQQNGYATAPTNLQQPRKHEHSTTAWVSTLTNGMGDLRQDTSSGSRSNHVGRQRSHIPCDAMNPLDMPNAPFVQDSPSMRGALDYVNCGIINPPQSGTQFVDRNFDGNSLKSRDFTREFVNMSHRQCQPLESIGSGSIGPRMNSSLSMFRNDLTQQIPPFLSTHAWDEHLKVRLHSM